MDDPQDEDHRVETILDRARRSDSGEPDERPCGFGGIRSNEYPDDNEHENEDEAAQDTGQTTPSQYASFLLDRLQNRSTFEHIEDRRPAISYVWFGPKACGQ